MKLNSREIRGLIMKFFLNRLYVLFGVDAVVALTAFCYLGGEAIFPFANKLCHFATLGIFFSYQQFYLYLIKEKRKSLSIYLLLNPEPLF